MKRASVVLPVYNNEDTIEHSVSSVLHQTETQFDLIIVNDGSTDMTMSKLAEMSARDNRISVINSSHVGVAEAFTIGIRHAKAKYIARMDADDMMHPERIEKQVKFLEVNPEIGAVSCLIQYGGNRTTQEGYARHVDWINTLITPEEIVLNRFIDSPVCNPSIMFRRELAEQYGATIQGDFPEDYDMWLRWMDAGVKFAKVPEVLFTWNDLPTRLTRNDKRYSPDAFERVKTNYLVSFVKKNNPEKRPVYLCGTGRITRKKSRYLVESGIHIGGYAGIEEKKSGTKYEGVPMIGLHELPDKTRAYVVSYISVRGAREDLRNYFLERNMIEGKDFVMAG